MRSCWFPASLPGIVFILAFALSCLHPSGTPGRLKQTDSANTAALLSRVWSRPPSTNICSIVPGGNVAPVQMLPPQPQLLLGKRSEATVCMTSRPLPHRSPPGFCQIFGKTSSQLKLKKHQVLHHQTSGASRVLIPFQLPSVKWEDVASD